MKWPLVTRREHDRRIREKNERIGILLEERDTAHAERNTAQYNREQVLRQLDDADAANTKLTNDNRELTDRLAACTSEKQRAEAKANRDDINAWDRRVRAHDRWLPTHDPDQRPVEGGTSRPTHPSADLRRALERCLQLEARLAVAEGRKKAGAR